MLVAIVRLGRASKRHPEGQACDFSALRVYTWYVKKSRYETAFIDLITQRQIQAAIDKSLFDEPTALLCSEPTAEHCHRRLVLEYLQNSWGGLKITHL